MKVSRGRFGVSNYERVNGVNKEELGGEWREGVLPLTLAMPPDKTMELRSCCWRSGKRSRAALIRVTREVEGGLK